MLGALRNFVRGEHIGDQPEPGVDWFFLGSVTVMARNASYKY